MTKQNWDWLNEFDELDPTFISAIAENRELAMSENREIVDRTTPIGSTRIVGKTKEETKQNVLLVLQQQQNNH